MKKIIQRTFMLIAVMAIINSSVLFGAEFSQPTPKAQVRKQEVENSKAAKLEQQLKDEQEKVEKAETPEAKEKALQDLEKKTEEVNTWLNSTQNFFGYGPKAEANRAAAQKRKDDAVIALKEEKALYDTLVDKKEQAASKIKQMKLQKQIHTEDIALGNKWSWKKRGLITAAAIATAYVLDQKLTGGLGTAAIGDVAGPIWEKVPTIAGTRVDPRTWSMPSLNPMNYFRSSSTQPVNTVTGSAITPPTAPVATVSVAPSTLRQGGSWLADKAATMVVGSAMSTATNTAYNAAASVLADETNKNKADETNKNKIVKIMAEDGRIYYMDELTRNIIGLVPPA